MHFNPCDEEAPEHWLVQHNSDSLRLEMIAAPEALPAHYPDMELVRDFEALTIGALAQRFMLTQAALKSRVHRGHQLMRGYLPGAQASGISAKGSS